jgi:hypothetical protein
MKQTSDEDVSGGIDGEIFGEIVPTSPEVIAPDVVSIAVELSDECVYVVSKAMEQPTANIDVSPERARQNQVPIASHIEARAPVVVVATIALAPEMHACGFELGQIDVLLPSTCERATAEVDGFVEVARQEDLPGRIDIQASSPILLGTTETLAPYVPTARVILGQEDVVTPFARQGSASEVGGVTEVPRHDDVLIPVHYKVDAHIVVRATKGPAPKVGAAGVELDQVECRDDMG